MYMIPLMFLTVGVEEVKKLSVSLNSLYHEKDRLRKVWWFLASLGGGEGGVALLA